MLVCWRDSNLYFYVDNLIIWSQNESDIYDIENLMIGSGVYAEEKDTIQFLLASE